MAQDIQHLEAVRGMEGVIYRHRNPAVAYTSGALIPGAGPGTIIPATGDFGGVKGSSNPYGTIVQGNTYIGVEGNKEDFRYRIPTQTRRSGEPDNLYIDEEEEEEEDIKVLSAEQTKDFVDPVKRDAWGDVMEQEGNDVLLASHVKYLEDIINTPIPTEQFYTPSLPPERTYTTSYPTPPVDMSLLKGIDKKRIRVRISGPFGNYRGHCVHFVDSEACLVLFYDVNETGFEPPISSLDQPMTVSCGDKNHKVYYLGMDIDLHTNDLGMQIYLKHKE